MMTENIFGNSFNYFKLKLLEGDSNISKERIIQIFKIAVDPFIININYDESSFKTVRNMAKENNISNLFAKFKDNIRDEKNLDISKVFFIFKDTFEPFVEKYLRDFTDENIIFSPERLKDFKIVDESEDTTRVEKKILSPNVVFTLCDKIPERYKDPIMIKNEDNFEDNEIDIGSDEIGFHRIFSYENDGEDGEDGEVKNNIPLTDFMKKYFPTIFESLNDGDIIRLEEETYRNDFVFLIYKKTCINLSFRKNEYGAVNDVLKEWFVNDFDDYYFHLQYPEVGTKEAIINQELKREILSKN